MALRFQPARGASVLLSSSSRGPTGSAATISVGTVTELAPGATPTVGNSGSSADAVLDFGLPGTPTIEIGTVTTVAPGQSADVTNSGTASAIVLDFDIPQGDPGEMGGPGASVDGEIALYNGTSGTDLKRATGSGLVAVSSGVFTGPRTLTGPAAGITVSNGTGVSGNPTLSLANDLAALEAMSGTGIVARTAAETYAQRTITGTSNVISVTNGDGVSGNPTLTVGSLVVRTDTSATLTVGFPVTPNNIGTVSSGTTTPAPASGNLQYYTNNGAHTLAAPSSDCEIDILVTNGASAGSITFSGFTVGSSTGSALTTTNTSKFIISIKRINSVATYSIYALQ